MSIPVDCSSCGRTLQLKSELAGKRVKCPSCGEALRVPVPDSGADDAAANMLLEDDGDSPPQREQTAMPRRPSPPSPPPPVRDALAERAGDYAPPRGDPFDRANRPAPSSTPEKKPVRERERRSGVSFEEGWFGSVNAGMIGGLLMMLIAVVWFVSAWAVGIICFYPPILFVIGVIAFLRGLANRQR